MKLTLGLVLALFLAGLGILAVFSHGIASASCEGPDSLTESGLYDEAREGYEAILAEDVGAECAVDGLLDVADLLCKQADRIRLSGAEDEAAKAYTEIVSFEPIEEPEEDRSKPPVDALQCALDGLRLLREAEGNAKKKACKCPAACTPACVGVERQEAEVQQPERQDPEPDDPEPDDPEPDDPEPDDPEPDDPDPSSCSRDKCDWTF